nr:unnamed protein product [Callosobruchus chinensis]
MNRGFAFVEFESHRAAAMARRQFNPENLIGWGKRLFVDWADPLPEVEPAVMAKVTALYINNLPLKYTCNDVHSLVCSMVGDIVTKVYKNNNFAFVHFLNRPTAEFAIGRIKGLVLANREVDVEWARPKEYSRKYRMNSEPNNFCRSVPPTMRRMVHEHHRRNTRSANNSPNSYYTGEPTISVRLVVRFFNVVLDAQKRYRVV